MSHDFVYGRGMTTKEKGPEPKASVSSNLKKILVIYTGGTFGMRADQSELEIPKLSASELKTWLKSQVPEMMQIASCDVDVLFNTDSCQFQAMNWFELAQHLFEKTSEGQYDGAVILHGTDTLAYTACALSALLSPTKIPIVITGAQKPLAMLRNDARTNFISALEVAANAPKELRNRVMVVFHDQLFLGSRVRKKSAVDFAAFETPRFPELARMGSSIQYHPIVKQLPPLSGNSAEPMLTQFRIAEEMRPLPEILQLQVTPQFASTIFNDDTLSTLDAILLTLYPSGTAPTEQESFVEFLVRAYDACALIFAITEREDEIPSLNTYAAGRELLKNHVLWCGDLTPEAAFVKIWLLREFHQSQSREDFYAWMVKNWSTPLSDETSPADRQTR
jgi:L-asparaginase